MTVAVLTDSAASLPPRLAERLGITVLPLGLVVGDEALHDGDLSLDELLRRFDEGVSTTGVAAGEVVAALESRFGEPDVDAALVLTISAAMSSTHEAARVGVASGAPWPGPAEVLDTGTAAGAQGLVVLAAAEWAAAGAPLEEVIATADRVADEVRLVATVDSLDHLVRSGRVPGIAGWAGRHLGVQPLFEFRRGRVVRLRPAFSEAAALDRIAHRCHSSRPKRPGGNGPAGDGPLAGDAPSPPGARLHVAALHALAPDRAMDLLRRVTGGEGGEGREAGEAGVHSFVGAFSPVMVAHTGPGLAGLAWWWEAVTP
jgi:DegV family protein with EDD domain